MNNRDDATAEAVDLDGDLVVWECGGERWVDDTTINDAYFTDEERVRLLTIRAQHS